jgi:hypothetical protein
MGRTDQQDAGLTSRGDLREGRIGMRVDARRLWSGGAASAVVAGLVALVGVLVSRWLFGLPVLAPSHDGAYGDVLMLSTPRPLMYFGWIIALLTTLVVVFPFSTTASLGAKVATAVVSLAIGVAIGMLVGGAAARSTTGDAPPPGDPRPLPDDRTQPYDLGPRRTG